MINKLEKITNKLEKSLSEANFEGYDLFDALNSPFLNFLTFKNRIIGIVFLQLFKRSPLNLRKLFAVKKGINPKGFGLMLESYVLKFRRSKNPKDLEKAYFFANWLISNNSKGYSGMCWGYNFDWPNRNTFFSKGTPTVVNTVYIANAFLALYELTKDKKFLEVVISSGEFILNDLNRSYNGSTYCFSYTPQDNTQIHNANMLASSLLASLYKYTKEEKYINESRASMEFSIEAQRNDGSWLYGVEAKNSWIDSFHTGYNLLALNNFNNIFEGIYHSNLIRGYNFYIDNFFTTNGEVKYFHDKIYPWDCHSFSHAIIALHSLGHLNTKSEKILKLVINRAIELFWDDKKGYFYYKANAWGIVKINYIRWVQMWMFYAIQHYITTEVLLNEK